MRQQSQLSTQDWQLLSAYLDGQLTENDQARLEKRLREQGELQAALDELKTTRAMLRSVGKQRVPRNFTLTPAMVEKSRPRPLLRLIPVLNFASAAAALAVVILLVVGLLPGISPAAMSAPAAAPMAATSQTNAIEDTTGNPAPLTWNQPAAGRGGGGGGGEGVVGGGAAEPNAMTAKDAAGGGGGAGFTLPPQVVESQPAQGLQQEAAPTEAPAVMAAPAMTATPAPQATTAPAAPAAPEQVAPQAPQPAATQIVMSQPEGPKEPLTGSGPILGVRPPAEAQADNSKVIVQNETAQTRQAEPSTWWIAPLILGLVAVAAALASWLIRRKTAA